MFMDMNRRRFMLGAASATIGGSIAHQLWLSGPPAYAAPGLPLPEIRVFDAREVGPVGFAAARRMEMLRLREACIGPLTPLAHPVLAGIDRMAQRWLHRSGSPYANEVDAIAAIARATGVHLLNTSYEWGCTALAAPAPAGDSARLLRTLDWSYPGLGRMVEVVRQTGAAGDFWNVTWPGAVGVLTAVAPGRFAAAINQAPAERRVAAFDTSTIDGLLNIWDTWLGEGRTPALHLLRRVFETAPDFATARARLEHTPIANPTIYSLVGLSPNESCVIERTRTGHFTRAGVASAANAWRYGTFPGHWRAIAESSDDEGQDSHERSEMIERFAGKETGDFAWVAPPILNGNTRLAVEADPNRKTLRLRGYEQSGPDTALPATAILDLALDD